MFVKQVVILALASLALAQHMSDMDMSTEAGHTSDVPAVTAAESEMASSQTSVASEYPVGTTNTMSTAMDSAVPTSVPVDTATPPTSAETAGQMTSMPPGHHSMATSVASDDSTATAMGGMAHSSGTGGMVMPNSTATPGPSIAGAEVSRMSVS